MKPTTLSRTLQAFVVALGLACLLLRSIVSLSPPKNPVVLLSVWSGGRLIARATVRSEEEHDAAIDAAVASSHGTLVTERVVGDAPLPRRPATLLALSIVPGHDGVSATIDGRTAYVTPDDLLSRQAYDHGFEIAELQLTIGVDLELVYALLAERLAATPDDVRKRASLRRIRVIRRVPSAAPVPELRAEGMTPDVARASVIAGADYLARALGADATFRYALDATTGKTVPGYSWPRHAGATYFLAQAAALTREPRHIVAALRAAERLRDFASRRCGDDRCVGTDPVVELGSSALTLLAFAEIARHDLDRGYLAPAVELARFLRHMQRPDGEFMDQYDVAKKKPIDIQYPYFAGEASLALSRVHRMTGDPDDLAAATRALSHLVGPAWHFFGDRYYFGEEHWTCQAMEDLGDRAPDKKALDFCLRWTAINRKMEQHAGEAVFDVDGAVGVGPLLAPRLTMVASRAEAGMATLSAAIRARSPNAEIAALDLQMRRSLALLVRRQLTPGPAHLFADPAAVFGGMPGTEVDLQIRIDFVQHAGSALVRYIDLAEALRLRTP